MEEIVVIILALAVILAFVFGEVWLGGLFAVIGALYFASVYRENKK